MANLGSSIKRIAIAGERGLVSRVLQARLSRMPNIVVTVVPAEQAATLEGASRLADADLAVLAVQEFISPSIVALLSPGLRILDVSPSFRADAAWVYGLPELPGQATLIAGAPRVANPGCFATAAILALEPLTRAGLLDQATALYLDAVGGYSTGGTAMESKILAGELPAETVYALAREHRHVPEIRQFTGMRGPLWFTPKVASFKRGIRMQVPLVGVDRAAVIEAYQAAYAGTEIVVDEAIPSKLSAAEWANRPGACLRVLPRPDGCIVVCVLDNLGKGAADSAFDNLALMLGLRPSGVRSQSV